MAAVCRVGDQGEGICRAHPSPRKFTTTFVTGAETLNGDGVAVCVIGTVGKTSCGHTTIATTGSTTVVGPDGKAVHRVGDTGIVVEGGSYVATTGSPDILAGD